MVILSDHIYDFYDVFLSFRGPDTRHGFTDHLYHQLRRSAIPTFRDDDELEKGEALKQQLDKAIRESSVSIIIFSQDYASSSWCLDEVVRILEKKKIRRNHKVLPIFYKVEASDVRYQKGSYETSFARHEEKGHVSFDKVREWRAALNEAANLVGLTLRSGEHETEFIGRIMNEVSKNLPNRKALDVPEHTVGMYKGNYKSWFRDGSKDNNVLFIYGIGGIGKTTITKLLFNEHFRDFEGSCFLARITETWDQIGVCGLQSQLLSNILNNGREKTTINSSEEGTEMIKRAIYNKKVIIVLDDVSEKKQLDALLGQSQLFCPGSKILVTSRYMHLQEDFRIHPIVDEVELLSHEHSLELFSRHAFRQHHPREEYKQLSEEILLRCEGLPLALEVLGSSLRKKLDIVFWEKQLQKWDEIGNPGIQKVMQISFDSLKDDTVKNIFLHVACFFVGEEEDYVVKILDHCGLQATVGIQNLIGRCLITRNDNKLMMHQVIQDMGREIVRQESPSQPGKRSRLWHHEDSFSVLKYDKGTDAIKGLILDGQKRNKFGPDGSSFAAADENPLLITKLLGYWKKKKEAKGDLRLDAFTNMVNLNLLKLSCIHLTGQCNNFPKELIWISWRGFPLEYVPMELPLQSLVFLDLEHSLLKQVWNGYMEVKSLKFLNLSYSRQLCQTPDFRGLLQLERLILRGCSNLVKVCKTIGILKALVLLDLRDCKSLRDLPALPDSVLTLELSSCNLNEFLREQKNIEKIFDWYRIVNFASPRIDVGPIKLLAHLPKILMILNLQDCNLSDECFPKDFSQLSLLTELDLSGNMITRLPDCIKKLRLERLRITSCSQLLSVIHAPSTVTSFTLMENRLMETIKVRVNSEEPYLEMDKHTGYFEIDGCLKRVEARKVDRKVIKNLGLESVQINSHAKVVYEFGIFSTIVEGREVPRCFATCSIKSTGEGFLAPKYSKAILYYPYTVPSSGAKKILGLNLCVALMHDPKLTYRHRYVSVGVCLSHKRKDLKWIYRYMHSFEEEKKMNKDILWVCTWKCEEDLLEDGDEVQVSIEVFYASNNRGYVVKECGIRSVYEEDDLQEEEDSDSLHWTDKLNASFSNYSIPGSITSLVSYYSCVYGLDKAGDTTRLHIGLKPVTRCISTSTRLN